ncbi:MFS transporter [Mycolicibacterium bacteremicum]|uniref:MFS transporter n=1 Tax=Mycolicibacterium bacteremicum TaxID=564198 RepID=A0A1W9YRU8_MYCBA|nr:MFS transporter [Mycolicibacterium bacteremicum]MCV7430326.1 MFS transporter [Mycolicibacterium bacteremicum]ORA02729.1 MFS transporter [Mycolicibacterium bacteremicum]
MTETHIASSGSWRALLGPKHLGASTVLAGGVALYATNEFLTISLMPSAVAEIGGQRYYAWVMTVYLVASVAAATTVSAVLARLGPRSAYLAALTVFGLGSVGCALAPTMELLLAGRIVQGGAGGLLAGLGYAVINTALPQALWTRASALVSAMWGVGTLMGPAAGGLFAQYASWRWAFGALVILTVVIAVLVPVALPRRAAEADVSVVPVPLWSLVLLGTAALLVSVAGLAPDPRVTGGILAAAVGFVAAFLVVDRNRASAATGKPSSVLPPTAFLRGPLKWIYLTLGVLMAATMVDMYVPLFGQRLAQLTPLAAGFLGVALAVGWTVSEIVSASVDRRAAVTRIVVAAPVVMVVGLGAGALLVGATMTSWSVILWVVALVVTGTGIGMAWPHLSAWAMGGVDDPAEGPVAAAAINTVQLICGAFGAGLAGVIVNHSAGDDAGAARMLFTAFAALAVLAVAAAWRACRRPESADSAPSR